MPASTQTEIDEALAMIRKIAEPGVTIIVIEHLMKVVLSISHRLVVLHHGQLIAQGEPRDVSERQERDRGLSRLEIRGRQPGRLVVTMATPKLSVSHLQAGYGDVQVLWDVTLEVGAGELVCLIGSNGAGKTTLMRCISGLLPATAGGIAVDGSTMIARDARGFRAGRHRPRSGRPPPVLGHERARQSADGCLSAARQGSHRGGSGARLCDVSDSRRAAAAGRRHAVGRRTADVRDRARPDGVAEPPADRRAVAWARAARRWSCCPKACATVNKSGVAILLVEQDVMNALELADRAYVIDHGRVTKSGPAMSLASDPAIREAYMGI